MVSSQDDTCNNLLLLLKTKSTRCFGANKEAAGAAQHTASSFSRQDARDRSMSCSTAGRTDKQSISLWSSGLLLHTALTEPPVAAAAAACFACAARRNSLSPAAGNDWLSTGAGHNSNRTQGGRRDANQGRREPVRAPLLEHQSIMHTEHIPCHLESMPADACLPACCELHIQACMCVYMHICCDIRAGLMV